MITRTGARQKFVISGIDDIDNETFDIAKISQAAQIRHVAFSANTGALGSGLSVDLLDGATNGAGTDVIQKTSDNLNGEEEFAGVNYDLEDGAVLKILADNFTGDQKVSWYIELWGK